MNPESDNCPGAHWCADLYEAQAAQLVLYGRALGLGHGEAEDVVQEVFTALLRLATPPEQPAHYLIRAFRNRALNHRRSLWRRVVRELESSRWFERHPDESPRERAAMRFLAELPREQREVLVLKFWHGRTFEEIGDLLEISPNTAAGRYRYGLARLRSRLQDPAWREVEAQFAEESHETEHSPRVPALLLDAATALRRA